MQNYVKSQEEEESIKIKKNKKIIIYGYSNRYGRAINQHQITKEILNKYYQQDEITWSNEGY